MYKIFFTLISHVIVDSIFALILFFLGRKIIRIKEKTFNYVTLFISLITTSLILYIVNTIFTWNINYVFVPEIIITIILFFLLKNYIKTEKKKIFYLTLSYFFLAILIEELFFWKGGLVFYKFLA